MKITVEERLIENLLDIVNQQQEKISHLENDLSDVKYEVEHYQNIYRMMYLFMLKSPESYTKLKKLTKKDKRLEGLVYFIDPKSKNELNEYGNLYSGINILNNNK